jgi:hypothetical protein
MSNDNNKRKEPEPASAGAAPVAASVYIPTATSDIEKAADDLAKYHVCVIRVLTDAELTHHRNALLHVLLNSPLFKDNAERTPGPMTLPGVHGPGGKPIQTSPVGGGGFCAASYGFYDQATMELRAETHPFGLALLRSYWEKTRPGVPFPGMSQTLDRALLRPPGVPMAGETVHRDNIPCAPGDEPFGGFLALTEGQGFSMKRGSAPAICSSISKDGFAAITTKSEEGKAIIENFKHTKVRVPVPVGCLIIFKPTVLHEVIPVSKGVTTPVLRLFFGWLIGATPLFPEVEEWLATQCLPKIPSGQWPPMWPKLWDVNWQDRRDAWIEASGLRPEYQKRILREPPAPEHRAPFVQPHHQAMFRVQK